MKQLVKKIMPNSIVNWYRQRKRKKLNQKSTEQVFTEIYNSNHWNSEESISGVGSQLNQTETLIKALNGLLKDEALNINSILDIPCGDFNWMRYVEMNNVSYKGADIVEPLIGSNKEQYKDRSNVEFEVLNLINDELPKTDVIFVRDCLVHLCYADIDKALKNIKASGSKYLLTTTFNEHVNKDIVTGEWRAINLQEAPFNFSNPRLIINENCTEGAGELKDKSMALWEINKLP